MLRCLELCWTKFFFSMLSLVHRNWLIIDRIILTLLTLSRLAIFIKLLSKLHHSYSLRCRPGTFVDRSLDDCYRVNTNTSPTYHEEYQLNRYQPCLRQCSGRPTGGILGMVSSDCCQCSHQ